jgi:hypothetical protein
VQQRCLLCLSQWMCQKMCSLAREYFNDGRKPASEGVDEAKQGAMLHVLALSLPASMSLCR